jgi:hypothetical protein
MRKSEAPFNILLNRTERIVKAKPFLTNVAFFAVAIVVGVFLMDKMLDASEQEDCWRMQRQHDAGYPVTVPEWCEDK